MVIGKARVGSGCRGMYSLNPWSRENLGILRNRRHCRDPVSDLH